ncbi:MAG: hypothetical protein ACJAYG_000694 [Oceanicoccus sp.]|jgi:hypothetical protein
MARLIILIALIIALLTMIQMYKNTPKDQHKGLYIKLGLSSLAIMLVLMAATGRIHWIGAMIGAMIPFVRRYSPMLIRYLPMLPQYLRSRPQPSANANNSSEVTTRILKMIMDHSNEKLQGEVISGPFAGQQLDSLELSQLQNLLDYCHQQETDSARLLMTYLNHRFGNDWQQSGYSSTPDHNGEVNEGTALAVLGLNKGASREQIIKAHRSMMQKVHPDRGGSDYLAAQINQAKDLLIKQLS